MFGKRARIIYAALWGLLTLPAGFLAALLWGLVRMDSGWTSPEPQLYLLWVLPVILFTSFLGELFAAQGEDTALKQRQAKIFFFLPLLNIAAIVLFLFLRLSN